MRSILARVTALALGLAGSAGCQGGGAGGGPGGGDRGGVARDTGAADGAARSDRPIDAGAAVAGSCQWDPQPRALMLPRSEVSAVLRGSGRNPSTTCTRQKGTGGPEAIFLLRLEERSIVELEVVSTMDTVVAVRQVCDDPLTEVACNDTPAPLAGTPPGGMGGGGDAGIPGPPPLLLLPADAALPAPGGTVRAAAAPDGRDGRLRTALDPGTYYVLVDEAEPFGVGGPFLLRVNASAPPAQASCTGALPIIDGTSLVAEQLDLAGERSPDCTGAPSGPALHYTARVPSGQRLTARVAVTGGDRAWTPMLALTSACSAGLCLATDRASPQGDRILRYLNNGPSEQQVFLSVAAGWPVTGASFRLDVTVAEPARNVTCETARPLSDGLVLRNQDLSEGQPSAQATTCRPTPTISPSLFYRATLLPQQGLQVKVTPRSPPGPRTLFILARETCTVGSCGGLRPDETYSFMNTGSTVKTVVLEVVSFTTTSGLFDMTVTMPLPPGRVSVSPIRGLVTSEAGAQASFEIVLGSPPLAPVVVPVESADPREGAVSPAAARFDGNNWDQPQKITVTGVDDREKDGARLYTIRVLPTMSADPRYVGLDGPDVTATNRDDEPGFSLEAPPVLATSEWGGQATFTVQLSRAPSAPVRLPLRSSNEAEGRVSPAELVFEPARWDVPQTVTLTGIDDARRDGSQPYRVLTGPAASADPDFAGVDPEDVEARNADDELERVATQTVSGSLPCSFFDGGQRIAVDPAGKIYVVMTCRPPPGGVVTDGGTDPSSPPGGFPGVGTVAFSVVSDDGGRTFAAPTAVGVPGSEVHIVAPAPGRAVVVAAGSNAFTWSRTEDGGVTWQPPITLTRSAAGARVAASGGWVALAAGTDSGSALWLSTDGGRTLDRTALDDVTHVIAIALDHRTRTLWLVVLSDDRVLLRKSTDAGATFDRGTPLPPAALSHEQITITPRTLFAVALDDPRLLVAPIDDPSSNRWVSGLPSFPSSYSPLLVPDPLENLIVVDNTAPDGPVVMRLRAGSTRLTDMKPLPPGLSDDHMAGVALSENAVALTGVLNNRVRVAVETWP